MLVDGDDSLSAVGGVPQCQSSEDREKESVLRIDSHASPFRVAAPEGATVEPTEGGLKRTWREGTTKD